MCRDWHELLRSPSLWSDVDLTQIRGHSTQIAANRALADRLLLRRSRDRCGGECREAYDARLVGYLERIKDIDPSVQRLSFSYDIQSSDRRYGAVREKIISGKWVEGGVTKKLQIDLKKNCFFNVKN